MKTKQTFDSYANNYHSILDKALNISGENSTFFALNRMNWVKQKLSKSFSENSINTILDYGCGTGDSTLIMNNFFQPDCLIGIDPSEKSIEVAKQTHCSPEISFYTNDNLPESMIFDFVYCNGVFHHIAPNERHQAVNFISDSLKPGGLLAFWENNPWNPGTRYIMSKCSFDEDAITLSYIESKRLLNDHAFKIINISFYFIFPKSLAFLRFMEKPLSPFPLGAQYLIIAQKL